jgi:hypothetical protein
MMADRHDRRRKTGRFDSIDHMSDHGLPIEIGQKLVHSHAGGAARSEYDGLDAPPI